MKLFFLISSFLIITTILNAQSLTGIQLLKKSIKYHDPDSHWNSFNGTLFMDQLDQDNKSRGTRTVKIDLPNRYFKLEQIRGGEIITREVTGDNCQNTYNGSNNISDDIIEKHQLNCERATMYRDYFSYLYGLPMKLLDPGTIVHPQVRETTFQNNNCYSLKITYEKGVGEDTWYFYFGKSTFAMIGYQFFHDESKNDGEYITLKGEMIIGGIVMPKDRHWYTNNENKFLGADLLKKQ